jgi:D-glycero-D-manno-heptose 1,7-bisphosphate phosphatase
MMDQIAVFLDRDGTVIEEYPYLHDPGDVALIKNAGAAISSLNSTGIKVILVTNQSGIARGFYRPDDVFAVHNHLENLLREEGAVLDAIYFCPHMPHSELGAGDTPCNCRKPETGLVLKAHEEHGIDLERSFFLGDRLTDVEVARRMGGTGILVKTGYGLQALEEVGSGSIDFLVREDISDAIDLVLSMISSR